MIREVWVPGNSFRTGHYEKQPTGQVRIEPCIVGQEIDRWPLRRMPTKPQGKKSRHAGRHGMLGAGPSSGGRGKRHGSAKSRKSAKQGARPQREKKKQKKNR
ncbi:MAG: hypothetical protein PHD95_05645 [Candidatus ainarchaeum sp.]|nr:hypothetical protein [Candidatus ainarchaeum sp.]